MTSGMFCGQSSQVNPGYCSAKYLPAGERLYRAEFHLPHTEQRGTGPETSNSSHTSPATQQQCEPSVSPRPLHAIWRPLRYTSSMRRSPLSWPDNLITRQQEMPNGCIEFTGGRTKSGYGLVSMGDGRTITASRAMWILKHGELDKGLEVDHLCSNRACVRIDHLEAVTHRENTLRGDTIPAAHLRKTHCPQGHPYSGDNLILVRNGTARRCRTCKNLTSKLSKRRQRS